MLQIKKENVSDLFKTLSIICYILLANLEPVSTIFSLIFLLLYIFKYFTNAIKLTMFSWEVIFQEKKNVEYLMNWFWGIIDIVEIQTMQNLGSCRYNIMQILFNIH